jgi:hypothetical protein
LTSTPAILDRSASGVSQSLKKQKEKLTSTPAIPDRGASGISQSLKQQSKVDLDPCNP